MPLSLETIVLEASDESLIKIVGDVLKDKRNRIIHPEHLLSVEPPAEATRNGVPAGAYDAYRLGLMSACADAVCVRDMDGKLEVPLISRAKPPFQGGWWVQGGAIFNFRLIASFVLWKVLREAKQGLCTESLDYFLNEEHPLGHSWQREEVYVIPSPLGVYRTAAEDSLPGKVCDTLNVAYLALWPAGLTFGHDDAHTAMRWVTLPELEADPNLCGHWYPQRLATRALRIVAAAKQELSR